MTRKLMLLNILLLLIPLFISGCWDSIDVDQLAIVIGVGIDRIPGEKNIFLTVQIVNPTSVKSPAAEGGGGAEKPFIVLTSQGESFFAALRNLNKTVPFKLFYAHNRVVVLGKNFAMTDISEVMDYMDRDREFRRTNLLVVAEKTAREVLETETDLEKLPAQGLYTLLTGKDQTVVYPINRNDFLLMLKSDARVSYAPFIRLREMNREIDGKAVQAAGKPPGKSDTQKKPKIYLDETAIFKDNRLIGVLDAEETNGLLWLLGKLKGDMVVIPYSSDGTEQEITIEIIEAKSKIIPHLTESETTMEIVCTGKASLRENESLRTTMRDLRIYTNLEQETANVIKKRIEQTITRAQKDLKADFLGFGNHIHNANPVAWKRLQSNWDEYFPETRYDINVQITIVKMGKIKSSATLKSDEE